MHDVVSEAASVALALIVLTCICRYLYIFGWKIRIAVDTTTRLGDCFKYLLIEFFSYAVIGVACAFVILILKSTPENAQLIASVAGQYQSVFGIASTCILISLTAIVMPLLAELLANTLLAEFDLNPEQIFQSELISMKHQGCRVNSKSSDELLKMTNKGGRQS